MGPDVVGVAVAAERVVGRHHVGLVDAHEPGQAAARPRRGRPARSSADRGSRRCPSSPSRDSPGSPTRSRPGRPSRASSSPARISPRRRWLSGVSISGTTISPSSPRVHGDEHDAMARGDGLGHGPTGADRLVVRVGVDGHQGRAMARGVGRHGVPMLAHPARPGDGSAVGVGGRPVGRAGSAPLPSVDGQPTRPGSARRPARRRLLDGPGRAVLHDAAGRPRAPTSSRSSRPRATRRAAGDRRGSGRPRARASPGPRPTTSRSTATSAASGSTSSSPTARPSCAGCSSAATSWSRTSGSAGSRGSASTTTTLRRLNPGLVHLAISGYGPDGPAADGPATTSSIQAASGLMSITGASDEDGGEPTKVGVAISDVVSGMLGAVAVLAALVGRERTGSPDRRRGPADRPLAPRIDPRQPRQPGAERVRQRRRARAARQRPPEHRPVRDVRDRRRRDRGRRRLGAAVAAAVRGDRCCRRWPRPALRDQRRPRRAAGGAPPDAGGALRRRARPRDWLAALDAADIPCGPINDVARGVRLAGGGGARDDRRAGASRLGRDPAGRRAVPAVRHAGVGPDARRRPSASTPTRSWPSSATTPPRWRGSVGRGSSDRASGGVRVRPPDGGTTRRSRRDRRR